MAITENLAIFLADFGVPCSSGAYAFTGVLDIPTEVLNMGGTNVLSDMFVLLAKTSDVGAGAIASGSALTVNGQAYTVRDVMSIDDGAFCHITLSK